MCRLPKYDVPEEIFEIEKSKKSKEAAAELSVQLSKLDKSTKRGYVEAFTKMVQFEEAAQSLDLTQFNTKYIKLRRSDSGSEQKFCIKKNVRK